MKTVTLGFFSFVFLLLSGMAIHAQVNRRCGGHLYGPQGQFGSPTISPSSSEYPPNAFCKWTISAAQPDETVTLKFLTFQLETNPECTFDYVTAQDSGPSGGNVTIAKYCGTSTPVPLAIRSKSNEMTVVFRSDGSTQYSGFSAEYITAKTECGGNYDAVTGRFGSPRDPATKLYRPDSECKWVITARPGDTISLKFLQFQLEPSTNCFNDFIDIQDSGVSGAKGSLGRFCGSSMPAVIKSRTNQLTIIMDTDGRLNFEGFIAEYLTERNGVVVDPTDPGSVTTTEMSTTPADSGSSDLVTDTDMTFTCIKGKMNKPTADSIDAFEGRHVHYIADVSRKCIMIGYQLHALLSDKPLVMQPTSPNVRALTLPSTDLSVNARCRGTGEITVDKGDADLTTANRGIDITLSTAGTLKCRQFQYSFIDLLMSM